jgi:hypothetical protein
LRRWIHPEKDGRKLDLIETIRRVDEPGKPFLIARTELSKNGVRLDPAEPRGRRRDLVELNAIAVGGADDLNAPATPHPLHRVGEKTRFRSKHGKRLVDHDGRSAELPRYRFSILSSDEYNAQEYQGKRDWEMWEFHGFGFFWNYRVRFSIFFRTPEW